MSLRSHQFQIKLWFSATNVEPKFGECLAADLGAFWGAFVAEGAPKLLSLAS
jgi:hypothetical protein